MASNFEDHEAAAHVLAIPLMTQGHITPMLRFATQLAHRGITVSFICYEGSTPRLTASSGGGDSSSELQSPNLRFVTLQKSATEYVRRANALKEAFEPFMEKLIRDKNAGVAGPTCIISDMFLSWSLDVAEKLQVPRYTFVPSGAIYARFMQGTLDLFESGQLQASEVNGKLVEFDGSVCMPGLPPLRYSELGIPLLSYPAFLLVAGESMMKSAGVLVNSFFELEEKVIEVFQNPGHDGDKHIKPPKIYPVGPLFSATNLSSGSNVNGLEDSRTDCLRWLDSQPPSSVLYTAFGSVVRLTPEQITELAYGLEASNHRFLWVCPLKKIDPEQESPTSITEVLPPGFQARVGDRGCIVTGWAPQLEILAHSSTGGFFTHGGWNSSLESVIFGVPMVGWPHEAEQHLNCKYLAGHLKVAEQLQTGEEDHVQRNEVERAVRRVMEGREIRTTAEELKKTAAAAVGEGGSQSRHFREFLDEISPH